MATRLVVAGVIGARLTWDVAHWDQIDSPLDLIAVWEGGLQFSGGFLGAIARRHPVLPALGPRAPAGAALDGYAYGLALGLAFGRIGCYSVGEHFGSTTSTSSSPCRYDGGVGRAEAALGDEPLLEGTMFHQHRALRVPLPARAVRRPRRLLVRRPAPAPGTLIGVFCARLRHRRASCPTSCGSTTSASPGLTGAQYACIVTLRRRRLDPRALAAPQRRSSWPRTAEAIRAPASRGRSRPLADGRDRAELARLGDDADELRRRPCRRPRPGRARRGRRRLAMMRSTHSMSVRECMPTRVSSPHAARGGR